MSECLETVHMYPSECAAIELFDETQPGSQSEKSIDDVIADKASPGDFQSYMPNSFSDLSGTIERERNKIAKKDIVVVPKDEVAVESENLSNKSSYGSNGSLFTESSTADINAILF